MTLRRLTLLPLLVACAPSTTAALGGELSSDDLADTEGADTVDDTDAETAEPEEEDEEAYVFPYTGEYFGEMGIIASSSWGDWEIGGCDVIAEVGADGVLGGGTECTLDWGGDDAYAFEMAGSVDEDGVVSGEMPLDLGGGEEYTMIVEGAAEEGGVMTLVFSVGGDFQLLGEAELTREN